MSGQPGIDLDLLAAYVSDECSPDERVDVELWEAASPQNQAVLRQLKTAWHVVGPVQLPSIDEHTRRDLILEQAGIRKLSAAIHSGKQNTAATGSGMSSSLSRYSAQSKRLFDSKTLRRWGWISLGAIGALTVVLSRQNFRTPRCCARLDLCDQHRPASDAHPR